MFNFIKLFRAPIISIFILILIFALVLKIHLLRNDNATLVQQNLNLTEQLSLQNGAILSWKKVADEENNKLLAYQQAARQQASDREKEIYKLTQAVVPKSCDKAIQWGAIQAMAMKL